MKLRLSLTKKEKKKNKLNILNVLDEHFKIELKNGFN